VAVAKRGETGELMRPIQRTLNTSKCVNERSFMRRMGFILFIGRVLSHIITADGLFTRNLFYTCANCPDASVPTVVQSAWGVISDHKNSNVQKAPLL